MVWGLYQGAFLVLERLALGRILDRLWNPLRHVYLILIVMIGWVVFRMESLSDAAAVLQAMFGFGTGGGVTYHVGLYLTNELKTLLPIAFLLSTPLFHRLGHKLDEFEGRLVDRWGTFAPSPIRVARVASYLLLLVLCLSCVAQKNYNPFIYFRF